MKIHLKKIGLALSLILIPAFAPGVRADTTDSVELARVKCPGSLEGAFPAEALPTASSIPLIDKLVVDSVGEQAGLDVQYRLYGPGATHWGQASFTSALTLGGSEELQAWFDEAAKGKNIRKNITVNVVPSENANTPGKSFILYDCFPVTWTGFGASARPKGTSSSVRGETLTVKVGRIEFKV